MATDYFTFDLLRIGWGARAARLQNRPLAAGLRLHRRIRRPQSQSGRVYG